MVTDGGCSRHLVVGLLAQRSRQRVVDRFDVRPSSDVATVSELRAKKLHHGVIGDRERNCDGVKSDVVVMTGEYRSTRTTDVDRICNRKETQLYTPGLDSDCYVLRIIIGYNYNVTSGFAINHLKSVFISLYVALINKPRSIGNDFK